jgi:hypothetical protein
MIIQPDPTFKPWSEDGWHIEDDAHGTQGIASAACRPDFLVGARVLITGELMPMAVQ